jgi:DNA modification methylase
MSNMLQLDFGSNRTRKTNRVVRNGNPTTDLILSASLDTNDAIFRKILQLYVKPGSIVADVTYGQGVFWRSVPAQSYHLKASDIQDGVDCRALPYRNQSIDCVVLDPPYMHTPGGTAHTTTHSPFEKHYRNNVCGNQTSSKYHEAVLDLYRDAGHEAHRVLKNRGVFIVKCQDEVCANRQRFTHIELIQMYKEMGFIAEDLFVVVRSNRPGVSRMIRQVHARKNHSYFLVLWKQHGKNDRWEPPK